MQPSRFGILIHTTTICAISLSLCTISIGLYLAVPKTVGWFRDLNVGMELPGFAIWTIEISQGLTVFFWPVTLLAFLLFIVGCVPKVPERVCSFSRAALAGISVLLVAFSGLLFFSVLIATEKLHATQHIKAKVFVSVLEEFALRESAENRWNEVQERLWGLGNISQKRIESANELSKSARSARVAQLARAVRDAQSPDVQKRILATLSMFRDDLERSKRDEEIVLSVAGIQAGRSFSNSKEFFVWLDQNKGMNGWEPIPLHTFTPKSQTLPNQPADASSR